MLTAKESQKLMITVWDNAGCRMLDTCYGLRVVNYQDWCEAEVRRLTSLGVTCHIAKSGRGEIAILRGSK